MTTGEAVAALRAGRVVGVPTDTVYGLAAVPAEQAVADLYDLKGRPAGRPIALLVASVAQAERVVVLTPSARRLVERHWPGALTVVAPAAVPLPVWVGDPERGTVGVRMPDHDVLLALLAETGPLAVTSANRSGEPPELDDAGARRVFGGAVAGYVPGRCPGGTASTVVDATGPEPVVLRAGPVEV